MKDFMQNKYSFLIVTFLVLFLSSCSSKYLSLETTYSKNIALDNTKSAFTVIAINRIYKSPIGIARFPDGGKTTTVHYDVALYYYDIEEKKLHRAVDLNRLFVLYRKNRYYRNVNLAFHDSIIYYKIGDADDYDIRSAKEHLHYDELAIKQAVKYVSKIHAYNIITKQEYELESLPSNVKWSVYNYDQVKKFKNIYLNKATYREWNIILKDIYPQSKKIYMQYIIEWCNDNTIKAIYEQIVPSFSKTDIDYILSEMDERKQDLYSEYKNNSDGVYQKHLKKDRYNEYIKYMEQTKKRLIEMGIPNNID